MVNINKRYIVAGRSRVFSCSCVLLFIFFNQSVSFAQKHAFLNYGISDGLIQSQINTIHQGIDHTLWLATLGGVSRFDGREFTPYSRQTGLPNNSVFTAYADKKGNIWFGTQDGLAKMTDKKIYTYPTPPNLKAKFVTSIMEDGAANMWCLLSNHLYKIIGNKLQKQLIQDTIKQPITCLEVDKIGQLYASVYRKGIYYLNKDKWVNVAEYKDKSLIITKIIFDKKDTHRIYLLDDKGIYTLTGNDLQSYQPKLISGIKSRLLSLEQDVNGDMWIGTNNGAYLLKNNELTHFTDSNGFTNKAITDIFNDNDNNLWLASQGNGLYKYEGDSFLTFDKSQGLPNDQDIMGITKDKNNNILLGINGGGIMRYDGNKLSFIDMPKDIQSLKKVQCLYTDKKKMIWIGTEIGGIWKYDGKTFTKILGSDQYSVNGITEDENGTIWVATPLGCFYVENNVWKRLDNFYSFSFSVMVTGKDSVIVGTYDGIALAVNKKVVNTFKFKAVKTSAVYCMLKYKDFLIVGTDDRGIFTLNNKTGLVKNYSVNDGLNSNAIYSLTTDEWGNIFAGTGRGVNIVSFDLKQDNFTISANNTSKNTLLESNQNAALYADHKMWIGTTVGVVVYKTGVINSISSPPFILIKSVRLLPETYDNKSVPEMSLTNGAKLSYNQNHITISFSGVYLKNPQGLSYQYKLRGLDSSYSALVKNNVVDYPSLPPGNYVFEVKAYTADGLASKNTASFSFSITAPFYQTVTFRLLAIAALILTGIMVEILRHRFKARRREAINKMRRDENLKIRQQTAEDFHDELGNKLTRITVLSDILDTKMDETRTDQKKLLEQIRQNASSLYNGTKDILWALDPKSDNLYEILNHIKDFGTELFLDTKVDFKFDGITTSFNQFNLPMEYSRNLPMIFKELLNNILKHAGATSVHINATTDRRNELCMIITDNGSGFDANETYRGQGLKNIINRTKRIGGEIEIASAHGSGATVTLKIKLNRKT